VVEFMLLGPVQAIHNGRRIELGLRQERCLLGLLLLEAARPVSTERLSELLWDGAPPGSARRTVQTYLSRLRSRVRPLGLSIVNSGGGYMAEVDSGDVDVHRFATAVLDAQRLVEPARQAAALSGALALWRGPLLADAATDRLRLRLGARLDELRMCATESLAAATLACGRYDEAIVTLTDLTARHPTRERLVGLLMTALYQVGRQVDALRLYQDTRHVLAAEYGVEPGHELGRLHTRLLRHELLPAGRL
jgi:DNA-binding SARP family transcriptional activator